LPNPCGMHPIGAQPGY